MLAESNSTCYYFNRVQEQYEDQEGQQQYIVKNAYFNQLLSFDVFDSISKHTQWCNKEYKSQQSNNPKRDIPYPDLFPQSCCVYGAVWIEYGNPALCSISTIWVGSEGYPINDKREDNDQSKIENLQFTYPASMACEYVLHGFLKVLYGFPKVIMWSPGGDYFHTNFEKQNHPYFQHKKQLNRPKILLENPFAWQYPLSG